MTELYFSRSFTYIFQNEFFLVFLTTFYKAQIDEGFKYNLTFSLIHSNG